MDNPMKIDDKILNEIKRYNKINNYILEQDAALPPPPVEGELPPPPDEGSIPPPADDTVPPVEGSVPPAPPATAQPVDIENDPDVEKIGDEEVKKNELEITDLVKSQQNTEKKQEEYFDTLFKHLSDLESKLSGMDEIVNQLNSLEAKVEKYRIKTPEERLELRSLDSGPFNQKLSQYFEDKQDDLEKSGKNEYVLTQDEVEQYSPSDIKKSFRSFDNMNTDEKNQFTKIK